MPLLDKISPILSAASNGLTVVVSCIAIYLFIFKKKPISAAIKALLNYSLQTTLSDLRVRLERLNDLNANEPEQKDDILNILGEVSGQIRGNKRLRNACPDLLKRLRSMTAVPDRLNEPMKRSLVAELRESLNDLSVTDYMGD